MRPSAILLCLSLSIVACEGGPARHNATKIETFGTYDSPDATLKIDVVRREVSLVDFTVKRVSDGKTLVSEYIGSDAMRWFLYWETPTCLWAYGSDIGYFKRFDFSGKKVVITDPFEKKEPIPKAVWDGLPGSLQKDMPVQKDPAPSPAKKTEEPVRR